jgi:Holliday junction resolvasome RuvABC ATP-dependent DNA helicase subunit
MNNQSKQQATVDLDTFDDVSLFQMIPAGTGMGLAHLKVLVDSVLNGGAKLNSIIITGNTALTTHSFAFLRALGIDNINQTYAAMFSVPHDIYTFFCTEPCDGYIINNIHNIGNSAQYFLCQILKKQEFSPYNYMEKKHDFYDVSGIVVMTSRDFDKVPESIRKCISHVVKLEEYSVEQLELVILQRCKYASVEIEDQYILQEIVQYGEQDLQKSILFLKTCIAVMQAEGRQILQKEDIVRAGRLKRLEIDDELQFQ